MISELAHFYYRPDSLLGYALYAVGPMVIIVLSAHLVEKVSVSQR